MAVAWARAWPSPHCEMHPPTPLNVHASHDCAIRDVWMQFHAHNWTHAFLDSVIQLEGTKG